MNLGFSISKKWFERCLNPLLLLLSCSRCFLHATALKMTNTSLVSVIRYASKLEDMKVQPFFYCLKELNDYVDWLPGDKPALTDAQLNLAFFNGMPGSWRVCYAILGCFAHTTTRAELLHYFRVQEHEQMTR
jgi:hypothetical protein